MEVTVVGAGVIGLATAGVLEERGDVARDELLANAKARVCDVVIVNDELPRKLRDVYAEEGQLPVTLDEDALIALGTKVVHANVISETDTVRHDPDRLAQVVLGIVNGNVAERASYVKFRAATPTAAAT